MHDNQFWLMAEKFGKETMIWEEREERERERKSALEKKRKNE